MQDEGPSLGQESSDSCREEPTWSPRRAGNSAPGPVEIPAVVPLRDNEPATWAPRTPAKEDSHAAPSAAVSQTDEPIAPSAALSSGRRNQVRTSHLRGSGPPTLPESGQHLFGFRLGLVLGQGSFARVFLAAQTELGGRQVALKVSDLSGDEPEMLAQLQHTHIVPIYSLHEDRPSRIRAVCMPYFGGAPLSRVLRRVWADSKPVHGRQLREALEAESGPPPLRSRERVAESNPPESTIAWAGSRYEDAAVQLIALLADALAHAHQRGVLHRDVKPSNVLLTADGQPMLLDFNVALDLHNEGATADQKLGGTLAYMAPEHLRVLADRDPARYREVDHRADIYSLGLVFYELLTGCSPFDQQGTYAPATRLVGTMAQERGGKIPSLRSKRPDLPWGLESILKLCLAPNPAQRYQSAEHLAEDCRRFLTDQPLRYAPEISLKEQIGKWVRRHPRLVTSAWIGTVAVLLLLAIGTVLAGVSRHLADTREQLTAAQDHDRRDQFQQGTQRALCLLHTRNDLHAQVEEGGLVCEATLNLYDVLKRDDWQQSAPWTRLKPEDRAVFSEDVRELLLALAWARRQGGDSEGARRALELLDRATAIDSPAPSRALLEERAACLDRLGQKEAALATRRQAAELRPSAPRDFYLLATTNARAGRYSEAIDHLNEALRRQPTHYWSLMQRGICQIELGRPALAAGDFGACIGVWPEFAWGYFNRAYAYGKSGNLAEAVHDYTRALERAPEFVAARVNRGMARLELGEFAGALEDLDAALAKGREEAFVHLGRGVALEGLSQPDEADRAYDQATAAARGASVEVMRRLWWVYGFAVSNRRPKQAWDSFANVLKSVPDHPEALYGQGMLLVRQGREAEAIGAYDRLLLAHPGFVAARRYRAILLARKGDLAGASADINRCLEQDPENGSVLYAAACVTALGFEQRRDKNLANQAIDLLKRACRRGYGREQAGTDADLKSIQSHPEFAAAVAVKGAR